jgi:hypothetical protein
MLTLSRHEGVWDRDYVEDLEAAALELRQLKAGKQMSVFETGKRYNTAFALAFELDHDNEDYSDLTSQDFIRAILRKLENDIGYGESIREVLAPDDTMENPDFPQEEEE